MLVHIKAEFRCDNCGATFFVKLDPTYKPPQGWSSFDVAVDEIRQGLRYEDEKGVSGFLQSGRVDADGRHLCTLCAEEKPEDDDDDIDEDLENLEE